MYVLICLLLTFHLDILCIHAQLGTECVHDKCNTISTFCTDYEN